MPLWGLEGWTKAPGQVCAQPKPFGNPLLWSDMAVSNRSGSRRGSRDQASRLVILKACDPLHCIWVGLWPAHQPTASRHSLRLNN